MTLVSIQRNVAAATTPLTTAATTQEDTVVRADLLSATITQTNAVIKVTRLTAIKVPIALVTEAWSSHKKVTIRVGTARVQVSLMIQKNPQEDLRGTQVQVHDEVSNVQDMSILDYNEKDHSKIQGQVVSMVESRADFDSNALSVLEALWASCYHLKRSYCT